MADHMSTKTGTKTIQTICTTNNSGSQKDQSSSWTLVFKLATTNNEELKEKQWMTCIHTFWFHYGTSIFKKLG